MLLANALLWIHFNKGIDAVVHHYDSYTDPALLWAGIFIFISAFFSYFLSLDSRFWSPTCLQEALKRRLHSYDQLRYFIYNNNNIYIFFSKIANSLSSLNKVFHFLLFSRFHLDSAHNYWLRRVRFVLSASVQPSSSWSDHFTQESR